MTINLFQPTLGQSELLAIADSFNTGWLGKGPKVAEFERAWAQHIGADFNQVVSTNSCTESLFTAVKLLNIGPGDEVIIPAIHFIGAAQAVLAAGATPVFCDVDRRTLNVTIENILPKASGKTRAVIVNHYGGVPCDINVIARWCSQFNIKLIEDAACAPASTYNSQAAGTFGDIGCWSFDAMKIISTGDGGMIYIRDDELAQRARKLLYLGIGTQSGLSSNADKWWEFEVDELGARRSVMNDLAAGMGLEQLKRLNKFIDRRIKLSEIYNLEFYKAKVPIYAISNQSQGSKLRSSFYFYWIQTRRRDELARYLRAQGIYTSFRYYPLHKAYSLPDSLPNAERAAETTLLLPLHCGLSDSDVEYICEKVKGFFSE